jgi:putative translation initiation factor aIF-2 beta subunit
MSSSTKKTVPIGVGITDAFYRYQMEVVDCEYKRRQNKTAILNMVKIAKDINRSPEEVIKYLGHSVSSSGSYSSKSQEYVLNGNYSQSDIQHRLQEYCEAFVVCRLCCNPETQYKIKRESIFLRCSACGGKSQVDETH